MKACVSLRPFLAPLAEAFAPLDIWARPQPGQPALTGALLASGEAAVHTVFPMLRESLESGTACHDLQDVRILSGILGTGVALLLALQAGGKAGSATATATPEAPAPAPDAPATPATATPAQGLDMATRAARLLDAWRDMLEDVELFSEDVPAAPCLDPAGLCGLLGSDEKG